MADKKEPQSYGSQDDWVSGHTAQKPNPEQPGAFEEDRESETSGLRPTGRREARRVLQGTRLREVIRRFAQMCRRLKMLICVSSA
jgi:hypothetical protein